MSSTGTHIIQKQYFDITFEGAESEGIALQQRMSSVCTHEMIPALEAMLERYAPKDGHLYIDRLDIDLGEIDLKDFDTRLRMVFTENMEATLREITGGLAATPSTMNNDFLLKNAAFTNNQTAAANAFFHFLNTGRLPWTYRLPKGETLENVIAGMIRNTSPGDAFFKNLIIVLRYQPARQRLARQYSGTFLSAVFNRLSIDTETGAKDLIRFFEGDTHRIFRQIITEAQLELLAMGQTVPTRTELFRTAMKLLRLDRGSKAVEYARQIMTDAHRLPEDLEAVLKSDVYATTDAAVLPEAVPNIQRGGDEDGIYIDNAGLVLLHPFLPMLFEGTGIVKEGRMIDPERALLLLHYLTSGSMQAPEYELTLSKILCGIPLETPVAADVVLFKEDIEEADALLIAVIRHWSALQNTSPDGLRGAFLLRPGKLSATTDGEWLLQVENQSFDILLDQIPWGISMIQPSWMLRMLRVEWRN